MPRAPPPRCAWAPIAGDGRDAEFTASGTVITFPGFLAAYEEGKDEAAGGGRRRQRRRLPNLAQGDALEAQSVDAVGHETSAPPRYTEASLIKTLEDRGIGRPSTYAATISTIMDRGYVRNRGSALVPSWIAFSVVRLLEEHFSDYVDYDFTAELEEDLDRIARGEASRTEWLSGFYYGDRKETGLNTVVNDLGEIDPRQINSIASPTGSPCGWVNSARTWKASTARARPAKGTSRSAPTSPRTWPRTS